ATTAHTDLHSFPTRRSSDLPTAGQMLVFGGAPSTSSAFDDLWSYDPTANRWTELRPTGLAPSPRSRHSAAWDAANRQMLIFGGRSEEHTSELQSHLNLVCRL